MADTGKPGAPVFVKGGAPGGRVLLARLDKDGGARETQWYASHDEKTGEPRPIPPGWTEMETTP
jgi:hypothetical protein